MLGRGQTSNVPPPSGTVVPAHHLLLGRGVPRRAVPSGHLTPAARSGPCGCSPGSRTGWAGEQRGERMGACSPHRQPYPTQHLGEPISPRRPPRPCAPAEHGCSLGARREAGRAPRIHGQRVVMLKAFVRHPWESLEALSLCPGCGWTPGG